MLTRIADDVGENGGTGGRSICDFIQTAGDLGEDGHCDICRALLKQLVRLDDKGSDDRGKQPSLRDRDDCYHWQTDGSALPRIPTNMRIF